MNQVNRSPAFKSAGTSPNSIRNSRSLPLKHIQKIVGNYTRRNCNTKLIPQSNIFRKESSSRVLDFNLLDDFSDPSRNDEELLNTLRSSPPKAEISLIYESKEEEVEHLKRVIRDERSRFIALEKSYRELLVQYTQNEIKYKQRISELEEKIALDGKFEWVQKDEFLKLAQRVDALESFYAEKKV
jgi:hypothetical protein